MTTAYTNAGDVVVAAEEVYVAQQDSQLLIDVMAKTGLAPGRRVADLCTGSGVVALAAATQGASAVTAFDICTRAVRCARANALARGVDVQVHLGSWARAVEYGPFDLVLCNPPYVPHDPDEAELVPAQPVPLGRSMPAATVAWCWTRCALRRPSCSSTAVACWWCIRSSPESRRP